MVSVQTSAPSLLLTARTMISRVANGVGNDDCAPLVVYRQARDVLTVIAVRDELAGHDVSTVRAELRDEHVEGAGGVAGLAFGSGRQHTARGARDVYVAVAVDRDP